MAEASPDSCKEQWLALDSLRLLVCAYSAFFSFSEDWFCQYLVNPPFPRHPCAKLRTCFTAATWIRLCKT